MLPHKPQTLTELRARFPKALTRTYDAISIAMYKSTDRPGNNRENVFDFEDGLRLIVSRDILEDHPQIHVSASFEMNSRLGRQLQRSGFGEASRDGFVEAARDGYRQLSATDAGLTLIGWSAAGIPHFVIENE